MTVVLIILAALLAGHGLRRAGLPEHAKEEEYQRAVARRARAPGELTTMQWFVAVLFLLAILGLILQAIA